MNNPQIFNVIPLRDLVMFPQMATAILIGRKKSINAVENSRKTGIPILAVAQISSEHDSFDEKNIHKVGVVCNVIESSRTVDGTVKVIIHGLARAEIVKFLSSDEYFCCEVKLLTDDFSLVKQQDEEFLGLLQSCIDNFAKYADHNKRITPEIVSSLSKVKSPFDVINLVCSFINRSLKLKQEILEENDINKKLYKTCELLQTEINIFRTEAQISKNIQEKIAKNQKEFYLHEQLKHIKKELGQDEESEIREIKEKIAKLGLPKEVSEKVAGEVAKLERMNLFSSEASVIRNYLDWIIQLPWNKKTSFNSDLNKAQKILDKNHYALKKVKDRILEFIAVQIKTGEPKGPILCLVGAPGVGKTSLAKAISEVLNRKYVKVSLGGVRDESEIRGHRKTYIGSMPGRIIQSMKKAKTINPLILLDEVDKMSSDFRGDPAAALLEVLDPEQNKNFSDHYLEIDYDLSKVMFIATANNINNIPIPLRDRMEVIRLSGYTENEKLQIAKKHLMPRQMTDHGLSSKEFKINDEAILTLIRKYTFEAGVRNLNREIANISRKVVRKIIAKEIKNVIIDEQNLCEYAGVEKFNYGVAKKESEVGIVTGLAYTDFGGDLLNIEAIKFDGSGKIQITGKLGEVMKESAQTALSYARFIAKDFKISAKEFNKYDFHIHVPEGATPKDGPSAGVAICVALISSITGITVNKNIAMTGEITLTGKVLEIGGLKEKLLAALRGEVRTVLIPKDNQKNLEDLPEEVLKNLDIKLIANAKEALNFALVGYKKAPLQKKSKSRSNKINF